MAKQCINTECNAFLEDSDTFCKMCGSRQPPAIQGPKKAWNFMKKKQPEAPAASGKFVNPEELEDFRLSPEVKMMQLQRDKKDNYVERLDNIETKVDSMEAKLDIMLRNHGWLLASVDAWLQGYKNVGQEEETKIEKNI